MLRIRRDQNSSFKVWFLWNACGFLITKTSDQGLSHPSWAPSALAWGKGVLRVRWDGVAGSPFLWGRAHLDQRGAEPGLVIVGGLHMGPALVLAPGPLLGLWLLLGLSCLRGLPSLHLPSLQAGPLGLRLSQAIAIRAPCLCFLLGRFPFGFQELVELLLGGEVSASRGRREEDSSRSLETGVRRLRTTTLIKCFS